MKNFISKIIGICLIGSIILLTGCASESMEFTTAKTALRSEKDFARAEIWFNKAMITDSLNAMVPYIFATEILRPQKRYQEMAEMFEEALKRNPDAKLDKPFISEENYISIISQGIHIYRQEAWGILFNDAINDYEAQDLSSCIEKLNIAKLVYPDEINTYILICKIFISELQKNRLANDDIEKEKEYMDIINQNLNSGKKLANEDIDLMTVSVDLAILSQDVQKIEALKLEIENIYKNNGDDVKIIELFARLSSESGDYKKSKDLYLIALELLSDSEQGNILKQLINVTFQLAEYDLAISYGEEAIKKYPNDPDIYYNVAVFYYSIASEKYNSASTLYNKVIKDEIREIMEMEIVLNDFKKARLYFVNAKDYFLEAFDLNPDDKASLQTVKEINRMLTNLSELYIPSTREMLGE